MPASKASIRAILVTSLLSFTVCNDSLAQAEGTDSIVDDEFIEHLIKAEGIRSLEVNSAAVTNIMNDIVLSKGEKPSYSELLNMWSNAPDSDPSKVLLALAMFSAGVSNHEREAIEFANKVGSSFYERDFKLRITEENLAGDSYSWLIDNVDFTVPKSLAEEFPKIVNEDTPYWGGTRDGYFNIEGSSDWSVFSSDEVRNWLDVLDDIESPDKEIWRGTIRNSSLKTLEIFRGLLVHNPEYLLNNLSYYDFPRGKEQWLNYWRFSGAYEYETHKKYAKAKLDFLESLKQTIIKENAVTDKHADELARLYIDVVEWQFTGHSGRSEKAKTIFNALNISPWSDLVEEYIWDHSDDITLRMVGGMLLFDNKESEFISYTNWLVENERQPLVGELISLAAISNKLTANIVSKISPINTWGHFNKTPLMYAAQFDDIKTYDKVLQLYPNLPLKETLKGEEYGELPKIGNRNVLMYALENSNITLINKILSENWANDLNPKDTASRDFSDYLELNEQLTKSQKAKLFYRIKSLGLIKSKAEQ